MTMQQRLDGLVKSGVEDLKGLDLLEVSYKDVLGYAEKLLGVMNRLEVKTPSSFLSLLATLRQVATEYESKRFGWLKENNSQEKIRRLHKPYKDQLVVTYIKILEVGVSAIEKQIGGRDV